MPKQLPEKLPKKLQRFFWEIELKKLDINQRSFYVAERLMDRGDLQAWRWLKNHYSNQDLRLIYQKSRNLPQFSRPFWAAYLKIQPLKKLCSKEAFQKTPGSAWPY